MGSTPIICFYIEYREFLIMSGGDMNLQGLQARKLYVVYTEFQA